MSSRKSFWLISFSVCLVLVFCLSGTVISGPGPNPGSGPNDILENYKASGPSLKAFLFVGWRYKFTDTNNQDFGFLEALLWVDDQLYKGVINEEHPETAMKNATANDFILLDEDLYYWEFPIDLEAYNMPADTLVVVLEEKDVSNFEIELDPINLDIEPNVSLGYRHIMSGNVRLTFLVPKKE